MKIQRHRKTWIFQLLAVLIVSLSLSGVVRAQETGPTAAEIEAERAKLAQERTAQEAELQQQRDALTAEEERLAQREQELKDQEAAIAAAEAEGQENLQGEKDALAQSQATLTADQEKLAADRAALETAQADADADLKAREDALATSTADLEAREKALADEQKAEEERKAAEAEAARQEAEAQAAAEAARKEELEKQKTDLESQRDQLQDEVPPEPQPVREVKEITASSVLEGGELSELWNIFKSRHPDRNLNDKGHAQVSGGTRLESSSARRIDRLPQAWVDEMMAIAEEKGYTSDNPDAPFLVAKRGETGVVSSKEAGRFQGELDARSTALDKVREVENEIRGIDRDLGGQGGPVTENPTRPDVSPETAGNPGPVTTNPTRSTAPEASESEDVTDLTQADGDAGGDSSLNGPSESPAESPPAGEQQADESPGAPTQSNLPQELALRGIQSEQSLGGEDLANLEKATSFMPPGMLKGQGDEGVEVIVSPTPFENEDGEAVSNVAGTWIRNPNDPPPKMVVYPYHRTLPDPSYAHLHEGTHQGLEQTSPGSTQAIVAAYDRLSPEDQQLATPSAYAAGDTLPGRNELAAEIMAHYLSNKPRELGNKEPYRTVVPPALKSVLDEIVAGWN